VTPTDTATPSVLIGDVNHDGVVDQRDIDAVVHAVFVSPDTPNNLIFDVNADGRITAADVAAVVEHLHQP
jgi:xyloglucan-specific exo-beta-1,4-glucanase